MIFDDFLSLIYPEVCEACDNALYKHEKVICTHCFVNLPKTNFHFDFDNPVSKIFWGRAKIVTASAYLYFNKGSKVQRLLHKLKYKGNKEVGVYLGKQYGMDLVKIENYASADYIVPVPLHPKKLIKRGYNQSDCIANGLSEALGISVLNNVLIRNTASETQTKKSRFERWQNVESIFTINDLEIIKGKSIILVDDVITTGATLEACINILLKITDIKVSVISIAYAHH